MLRSRNRQGIVHSRRTGEDTEERTTMLPIIAGLLSQGLNLVANAALAKGKDYVKEKTGVDLNQTQLTREDLIKLKQFEYEHEEELLKLRAEHDKLNLTETQLYIADAQDARKREAAIATSENAPWYNKAITPFLAVLTVLLTFGAFARMIYVSDDPPPPSIELVQAKSKLLDVVGEKDASTERIQAAKLLVEAAEKSANAAAAQKSTQKEIMLYILGVLSAIATQIYAYYFGSSKGSARKDETIAAFAEPKGE